MSERLRSFHIFGLDEAMSIVIVVSISCVLLSLSSVIVLVIVILLDHCKSKHSRASTRPINKLIPPIYYTDGLKDPLHQEDLVEKSK